MNKTTTIGIIAHVDSGKTTLSEALLFLSGGIRTAGRVDKGDSFLDHESLERKRGITIFSKQARFTYGNTAFVLIDTPGHTDFSAETERALPVLDYAVLLVSAPDGVRGQTKLLWDLLAEYKIPAFVFFNKTDQIAKDREALMEELNRLADGAAVDFSECSFAEGPDRGAAGESLQEPLLSASRADSFREQLAMCSETAMNEFFEQGFVSLPVIREMIRRRQLFPCFFGSALRMEGIEELLAAMDMLSEERDWPEEFSAKVYKIARAEDGSRLTFLKVTGGSLKVKSSLPDGDGEARIHQIRLYSGTRFTLTEEAAAGDVCALTGLSHSRVGQVFGAEKAVREPLLTPVLSYRLLPGEGWDAVRVLPYARMIEEESPELSVRWDEDTGAIFVHVMGTVQLEILTAILKDRFGIEASFDSGEVLYKETLAGPVIGVGHFEPLRHYAEVHLLLEPLPAGSGLVFDTIVPTDVLAKNWQRLILTHLAEKRHRGVLTGAPVTDLKITLIAGKAHLKHTEGGDFRQAVYRAVRQGLMLGESILLEPYYSFSIELPTENVGRALHDLDRMQAKFQPPDLLEEGISMISGTGPVAVLKGYPAELASCTRGRGRMHLMPAGYGSCHNAEEVIAEKGYDPLRDLRNSPDSVFCMNGAGTVIPYDEVYPYLHLPVMGLTGPEDEPLPAAAGSRTVSDRPLGTEEVDAIIAGISRVNAQKNRRKGQGRPPVRVDAGTVAPARPRPKTVDTHFPFEAADILVADGYNIIFAWPELKDLAKESIDAARNALIDILDNYHAMAGADIVAVFDAYKVRGRERENIHLTNITIVFTQEDETADQYIEKYTNENGKKKRIAVVTSDSAEQVITGGQGCMVVSSREFRERYETMKKDWKKTYGIG